MRTLNYIVDYYKINERIKQCMQDDTVTVTMSVFENETPVQLEGKVISFEFRNPDKKLVLIAGDRIKVNNNTITVDLKEDGTKIPGTCVFSVAIKDVKGVVRAFPMYLVVTETVTNGRDIEGNVISITEELTKKNLESLSVKQKLDESISNGNTDKMRSDLDKVSSQLENKTNVNNNRVQVINGVQSTTGTFDFANFAGQGKDNAPIGNVIHHYTDAIPIQIDNVGENYMGIMVLKNARNPLRRPDKPFDYYGSSPFLACKEESYTDGVKIEKTLLQINKEGNLDRTGGTLVIKGGINARNDVAVEINDIYGERDILKVGVNGDTKPTLVVKDTLIKIKNGIEIKEAQILFPATINLNSNKIDDGMWGCFFNINKHGNAYTFRNGGVEVMSILNQSGIDLINIGKSLKYTSQATAPAGLYGNTYYDNATGYFYAYDKMGEGYRPFNEQYGIAIPTTGTWKVGDKIYNKLPTGGGYLGWVCITAGTPGIWKGFGLIQN